MAETAERKKYSLFLKLGLLTLLPFIREWRGRSGAEIVEEGVVSSRPLRVAASSVLLPILAAVAFLAFAELKYKGDSFGVFFSLLFALFYWAAPLVIVSVGLWFLAFRKLKAELQARAAVQHDEARAVQFQNIEALLKRREQIEESLFERNLKDTFYLQSLSWEGASLFEDGSYHFAPRVNVLLGKNGYGKTLLFRTLAALVQRDAAVSTQILTSGEGRLRLELTRNGKLETVVRTPRSFEDSVGKIPLLAIPDSRFVNRSLRTVAGSATGAQPLSRSGALNFLTQQPYENVVQDLLSQMVTDYFTSGLADFASSRFRRPVFRLIEEVVRNLTDDKEFAFHSIEPTDQPGFEILVRTGGSPDTAIPIQYASQGTLSIVAIFGLIYRFLRSLRPQTREQDVLALPAIVLIDELDAHLHPAWQQRILELLTAKFPNVQFIVSAHSPVIVAGCDIGEVAVLRRRRPEAVSASRRKGVFLSSTARDLAAYRQSALDAVESLGMQVIRIENFLTPDAPPPEDFVTQRIAECDLFVILIGHLLGASPPGSERSYSDLEYDAALRYNKPILVFMAADDLPVPANLYESDSQRKRQVAFRERAARERVCYTFHSPDDFAKAVAEGLYNWKQPGPKPQPPRNGRFAIEMLERDFLGATAGALYELVFEIEDIDRLYLEYTTKAASGGAEVREREIDRLQENQEKADLSREEKERLDRLIREDRLVRRAEEARQERLKHEQTQSYIAQLEGENARLKRALDRRQTSEERGDVRS